MMKRTSLFVIVAGAALAGCANLNDPMSVNQDHSATINFAEQVEDPTAKTGAPSMIASMSDKAIVDYATGQDGGESDSEGAAFTFNMQPAE